MQQVQNLISTYSFCLTHSFPMKGCIGNEQVNFLYLLSILISVKGWNYRLIDQPRLLLILLFGNILHQMMMGKPGMPEGSMYSGFYEFSSVRSYVHLQQCLSRIGGYFFWFFCIKLRFNNHIKVTQPIFVSQFFYVQNVRFWGPESTF